MATEPDNTDSGALGTILAVLGFGVLFAALGITALVRAASSEIRDKRAFHNEEFAQLRGQQEADLNLPASYVDEGAGVVRLPIDRAMQVVVRDLQNNPWSATAEKPKEEQAQTAGEEGAEKTNAEETGAELEETVAEGDEDEKESGDDEDKQGEGTDAKPPPAPKTPRTPPRPKPAAPAPTPPPPKPAPAVPAPAPKPAVPAPKPAAPAPVAPKPPAPAPATP
jgi:hypothetical protein